ncbi:hypothetical protein C8J56DRAFT_716098, partial [Mycena floridula]
ARDLIRDLVCDVGLREEQIMPTIQRVATQFSMEVDGEVSNRSIGRIVLEGGVAAKLQLVEEAKQAQGITISSDGTSHKHLNYMSRNCKLIHADRIVTRFLGITGETNHTSEEQLTGFTEVIQDAYAVYNRSPLSSDGDVDWRDFLAILKGMITDHAED